MPKVKGKFIHFTETTDEMFWRDIVNVDNILFGIVWQEQITSRVENNRQNI